ncbi:flavin reductase family protein [Streptomyces sp. IBSBF 2435]|uniref:flavin reductase family protein n=1 Tax=Streptomyces sp. IBSBF 2435 TaxID=2903531 RepID=UPI002FDBCC9B
MTALASADPDGRPAPVGATELRRFMRRWATGAAVVTSGTAAEPVGCTVNALTSVSLDPPLLLISLERNSRTLAGLLRHGSFGVNVLAWRHRRLAAQFAAAGDRFAGVDYRLVHDVPVLEGSASVAVCRVERTVPVADHVLVLGSPRWCHREEDAEPVVLLEGDYGTAGPGGA